jgi:hypothetical protein
MCKNLERSGWGLTEVTSWHVPAGYKENHVNTCQRSRCPAHLQLGTSCTHSTTLPLHQTARLSVKTVEISTLFKQL